MERKILYSVFLIGLAIAAAGAGTTAFFNDTETAENNTLVAGELDLKIDWNQSYNGEWVNAWPVGNNGQADLMSRDEVAQDMFGMDYSELNETAQMEAETVYRNQFADLPDDTERPIIELTDVKPGDWGEVTFSVHIFDNPGYVWMTGELKENAENGVNEPESKDPDEDDPLGPDSGTNMSGELMDAVNMTLFYDRNGNNQFDEGEAQPLCLEMVLDNSESMENPPEKLNQTKQAARDLINELANQNGDPSNIDPHQVSVDYVGTNATIAQTLTNDTSAIMAAIDGLDASGGATNLGEGIQQASGELANCTEGNRKVMLILTNGAANIGPDPVTAAQDAYDAGNVDNYFTIAVQPTPAHEADLHDIANISAPPSDHFHVEDFANISVAFDELASRALGDGDQVIAEGKLMDIINATQNGKGFPLDANIDTEEFDALPNSETRYVALMWSLPVDHANEIQSDSMVFDLGFYAEQERHNNASGMMP